ncbi:MAG: hypothetical protein ACRDTA_25415 [Pseudonocardiaceae bacterium]
MNIAGIFSLGGGSHGDERHYYDDGQYSYGGYYGSKNCCRFGTYNGYNRSYRRDHRGDGNDGLLGFLLG